MAVKKKPGRPRKSADDALSATVRVRLRPAERAALEKRAQAKGVTLSAWARGKLLEGS